MAVTEHQKNVARARGLSNVNSIVEAARKADVPFHVACALFFRESKGRNVYGNDVGGMLSGFPSLVNEHNYAAFRWMVVVKGMTSNGVGPSQITSAGLLQGMEGQGLRPYDVEDNMLYGLKLLRKYHADANGSWRDAYTRYNGSEANGAEFAEQVRQWKEWLG